MSPRSALRELADRAGIVPWYLDQTGKERRPTSDHTRVALLAAMGIDAATPARAAESLAAWRPVPAPIVRRSARRQSRLKLTLADLRLFQDGSRDDAPRAGRVRWRADVVTEGGELFQAEGTWRSDAPRAVSLPFPLPFGYHTLRMAVTRGGRETACERRLIIVPHRCVTPRELLDGGRCFGVIANLYTLRSPENWGIGDLSDLGALAAWSGSVGADFVGVNPLHALLNRGGDISPYSPVSRLFRNPIYIDVSAVPELCDAPELLRTIASSDFQASLEAVRESSRVCYEPVMARKQMALDALYRVFARRRAARAGAESADDERQLSFDAFARLGGAALDRFATWMAIADHQRACAGPDAAGDWRRWPSELRDPDSTAVREFALSHADRVDFHRWLQFEADRQLGAAADRARHAGMRIGLYEDLAIGSAPGGADTWAHAGVFAHGVSVGAPPDPYAADGQNWGLPPLNPRAFASTGYEYFIQMVRAGFRHAGALRIDHVMGLFRLFWIPEGARGADGAYVRYPADDLLGIVALESMRHGALVVGEDLGTVPREVPAILERRGVLSSRVLYFERTRRGGFKAASGYKKLALATANTHDMPTLAAFVQGRDITLRREAGLIESDAAEAAAREERERDKLALVRRLSSARVLGGNREPERAAEFRGAVHAFLCKTPSQLVGLSLDDLAGEIEPVNLPGVGPDRFPSWTRKMNRSVAELASSPDVVAALRCGARGR